jgi:hypothetical protein
MKKKLFILFVFILFVLQNQVYAKDLEKLDWDNLVQQETIIKNHPDEPTPYNEIPGNLSDIYEDVNTDHWAYQALYDLSKKYNILEGYPDGKFNGEKNLTRYELAQVLANLVKEIDEEHIQVSPVEKAALNSLKSEFEKEIMTLAARIEINAKDISEIKQQHESDISDIATEIKKLQKRHHFTPELRLRLGLGDPDSFSETRIRLASRSFLTNKTSAVVRLEGRTLNMINHSERDGQVTDADLTLAYIETEDLTRWLPEKDGKIRLLGGLLETNRLFLANYRTAVDQRGFSDTIPGVSLFNSQYLSFMRIAANGRVMSLGGEYSRQFDKYNGLFKAGGMRSTGGSIDIAGYDIPASGKEATFYCVTGQMDLPIKSQPVELKLSHYYSFNDMQTNENTWSAGGRLATKFKNVGVFKTAIIGFGGTVPPRYLGGYGGNGISYQFAFNPASKVFGNLFGDPDKITHSVYNYIPGKTEIGFAFANFHNRNDESLRVLDLFVSRYITNNIWGVLRFTHANPNTRARGLSAQNSVELLTVFRF